MWLARPGIGGKKGNIPEQLWGTEQAQSSLGGLTQHHQSQGGSVGLALPTRQVAPRPLQEEVLRERKRALLSFPSRSLFISKRREIFLCLRKVVTARVLLHQKTMTEFFKDFSHTWNLKKVMKSVISRLRQALKALPFHSDGRQFLPCIWKAFVFRLPC